MDAHGRVVYVKLAQLFRDIAARMDAMEYEGVSSCNKGWCLTAKHPDKKDPP
jgi:hypothetical protein